MRPAMTRFSLWDAKFLVYLTGGVVSALVDIGIMQLLIAAKVAPLLATSVGFVCGLFVNYLFHSRLTFKNAAGSNGSLPRYLSVVALNYLLTLGLVAASLALFDQALAGKLLSLPVIAVNGYLLGKHWIFK
jgi:putative flippase GtrA